MDSLLPIASAFIVEAGAFSSDVGPSACWSSAVKCTLGNVFAASLENAHSFPNVSFIFYLDSTL